MKWLGGDNYQFSLGNIISFKRLQRKRSHFCNKDNKIVSNFIFLNDTIFYIVIVISEHQRKIKYKI